MLPYGNIVGDCVYGISFCSGQCHDNRRQVTRLDYEVIIKS